MKKLFLLIFALGIALSTYQCSSTYKLEQHSVLKPNRPYFQNWMIDIQKGESGYNIILPNLNPNNEVTLDSIYFRGIKAKLVRGRAKYTAKLKNPSPYERDMSIEAAHQKDEKNKFPFELSRMDCVISYIENGVTKYLKIPSLSEKQGTYYEKGLAVQENENDDDDN